MDEPRGELNVVADPGQRLREFSAVRDWEQFHSPKNLAMALAAEAGELSRDLPVAHRTAVQRPERVAREQVSAELADVQIYLLRLADVLDIDLPEAVDSKIDDNEGRYPVELSKGTAVKYSQRGSE